MCLDSSNPRSLFDLICQNSFRRAEFDLLAHTEPKAYGKYLLTKLVDLGVKTLVTDEDEAGKMTYTSMYQIQNIYIVNSMYVKVLNNFTV